MGFVFFSNLLTVFWCLGIVAYCIYNVKNNNANKNEYTTLGMLGTFVGIAIGLCFFDTSNINQSLPQLLGGLQLAFWTSIAGLGSALYHKWHFFKFNEQIGEKDEQTDDLLKNIAKNIKVLGEDKESSIIGQLKLLRSDFGDFAKKVADSSAKSATKAIVEALTQVVKDFNSKITEQFGDNFKELNSAVEKLVIWQNEYKQYMESFKSNLELCNQSIKSNSQSIAKVPEFLENIQTVIKNADDEIVKLSKDLIEISDIANQARKSIPEIEDGVKRLAANTITETTVLSKRAIEAVQKSAENSKTLVEESISKLDEVSKASLQQINDLGQSTGKVLPEVNKKVAAMLDDTNNQLAALGGQVIGISQKLIDTYKDLGSSITKPKKK